MTSSNTTFSFISTEYITHKQYNQTGEACLCAVRETVTAMQQAYDMRKVRARKESMDGGGVCSRKVSLNTPWVVSFVSICSREGLQ